MRYEDLNKAIGLNNEINSLNRVLDQLDLLSDMYASGRVAREGDIKWILQCLSKIDSRIIANFVQLLIKLSKEKNDRLKEEMESIL